MKPLHPWVIELADETKAKGSKSVLWMALQRYFTDKDHDVAVAALKSALETQGVSATLRYETEGKFVVEWVDLAPIQKCR